MIRPEKARIAGWAAAMSDSSRERLEIAARRIAAAKEKGRRVTVVTGSGPNIHEGVTTLIAHLIRHGVVDAVLTSSAVVAHEMAGTLDRVRRIRAAEHPDLGIPPELLPRGGVFEITECSGEQRDALSAEIGEGWELYDRIAALEGDVIVKAAGNMAWPMGPRTERLAREAEILAR